MAMGCVDIFGAFRLFVLLWALEYPMAISLGLHSSLTHFVSSCSWSSLQVFSVVLCASFSDTRIPTPPPFLFGLDIFCV